MSENYESAKDFCGLCSNSGRRNQKVIQCNKCDAWYHANMLIFAIQVRHGLILTAYFLWLLISAPKMQIHCLLICKIHQKMTILDSPCNARPCLKLLCGLRFGHSNVNCLYNKLDQIKKLLAELSLDILGISETWLTADIRDNELYGQGYT